LRLVLLLEIVMLVFALLYFTLAVKVDDQMYGIHTRLDALYFTVTTMTTVGYGDIHPVGQLARAICTIHLVFDLVFIAAFAGLVRRTVSTRVAPPPVVPGPGDDPR
jgi:voltage-gated potassium channel Kch